MIDGNANEFFIQRTKTHLLYCSGHPFWIQTVPGGYNEDFLYTDGLTPSGGVQNGILQFVVPYDAPNTLFYVCRFHSTMKGIIVINDLTPDDLRGPQGPRGQQGIGSRGPQGALGDHKV